MALAVAGCGVTVAALAAHLPGSYEAELDVWGWLVAPALGLLLLARRRAPALVVVVSAASLVAYYVLGYPPVGLALPLAGSFFSAAEQGRMRWAAGTGCVLLVISYGYRVRAGQDLGYLFGYDLIVSLVILVGAVAAGDAVRSRRLARAAAARRIVEEEARRERESQRVIDEERKRLAREVHDVLAHTTAVISLHSDVALESLHDDPDAATAALQHVRHASRDAMRELRTSLALLRGDSDDLREPVGTMGDLEPLARTARDSGLSVWLDVPEHPALTTAVDSTAYSIVREALTNVLRHSGAEHAHVAVRCESGRVEIRVRDDGNATAPIQPGHGLIGMRERAALLGGTLVAEPVTPHGFSVRASLPITDDAA